MFIRRGLTDWRDPLIVAQTGEPDSSDIQKKSDMTQWGHCNSAAVCTNFYVCVLAEADSDAPFCSTASCRKKETFHPIYSNTARHGKALTPQQHPSSCLQLLEVGLRVGLYLQDCLQNWFRCTYSLLVYFSTFVFVCLWSVSSAVSGAGVLSVCKQDRSPEDVHPPHH